MDPLPQDIEQMLGAPNPAVIATVRRSGQPVTVPTWYEWTGDNEILVNMDAGRVRLRHMRNDERVALTILDEASWLRHVSFVGSVTSLRDDPDYVDIDRLSQRYLGVPYQNRTGHRVTALIRVTSWYAWDARSFVEDGVAKPIK